MPVIRLVQGIANIAGEVDVGGSNDETALATLIFIDRHDPCQGVFNLFFLRMMLDQGEDFLAMREEKLAGKPSRMRWHAGQTTAAESSTASPHCQRPA